MAKHRVLITGGTGLLGQSLLERVPAGVEPIGFYHRLLPPKEWREQFRQVDVLRESVLLDSVNELKPRTVIHAASVGGVDEAERDPESVRLVNVEGTRNLLRACERTGANLIFISSNAVFDGSSPPYSENSPLRAANRYGQIKIEAERLVRSSCVPHLIVRPILMYGWPLKGGRGNAVTRWLEKLEKGEPVEVAEDIISMPLWVGDCSRTIWEGTLKERRGIVHAAGADRVNLAQFAREVCSVFGCNPELIHPVQSKELAGLAPRPPDTSFQIERMRREFGIQPLGLRQGLTLMRQSRALSHAVSE